MMCIGVMVLMLIAVKGYDLDWDVRLEGGESGNEGRLEIRPPGKEWGTVCQAPGNEDFPDYVPCNLPAYLDPCYRLGYVGTYSVALEGEQHGKVNGPIWFKGVQCPNDINNITHCQMSEWSLQQGSCDHSSDLAVLCITETVRLSGGCTAREGWVEVSLGAARWARLKNTCFGHISRVGADLVCKHLGYPMAIGTGNPCKINEPDGELPEVKPKDCSYSGSTLQEYLRNTVLRCDNRFDSYDSGNSDWELACAYDDEVIATNVEFTDFFKIRLVNGSSQLVGILELRHYESSWAPACFYNHKSRKVGKILENVCNDLGQNCPYNWKFVEPNENQGLEYVFREDTRGNVSWLQVENRCLRHGGFNLHIECSIDVTLNTVTVHILPNQTCRGRCGDLPTHDQCGCDFKCHIFKDCCFDIDTCVLPTEPEFEPHPFPNVDSLWDSLLDSSEHYECLSAGSTFNNYELVSICPDTWPNDTVRYQCESPHYSAPVLYLPLPITFKNIMCAYCHGVEQFLKISPTQEEDSNATITIQPYYEDMLTPVGNQGSSVTRPCTNLVSTCLDETHELQHSCQVYEARHSRYKNPHCALCNGVDLASFIVCQKDNDKVVDDHPPYETNSDQFISISSSLIGGVPDEIPRDYHVVSLDVEIMCWQEQSTLEVTMLDSTNEREDDLSGLDSMKCLIYAVAYSNLNLALHFSSSLRSLLDSESQVGRSGVTASIISWTLSEIDDFSGTLDKVLRVDGDVTQTDWGFRCGLAEASLIHECSIQPIIASTSNINNECIDTEEGASISMNISGELFVYVIDGGTLITPVNITTTIAYDVHTDKVTKRKLIQFCGKQNKILTCKTLTDFNNMYRHSTYIESPETNATLPNGETIVCFTNAQLDPFSRPEQIVNLVCFGLSLAGLTATLITYSVFSTLRNAQGLAVMSLSLAILTAQLSSILSQVVVKFSIQGLCSAFAVITQYSWLSAFAWMAAISWDFMRTFSGISLAKTNTSLRKFRRLCLVAWCSPLLVIIPHLILHFCDCTGLDFSYGSEVSCWIANKWAIFIMFCVPVILCICFNVACFGWTVRCIRSSQRASALVKKNASNVKEAWLELLIYVKISSLMGFAWIIGFIALATNFVVFWYLFTIFSSFQGVFIFLSFAFTGRVRALWSALLQGKQKVDLPTQRSSTEESRL